MNNIYIIALSAATITSPSQLICDGSSETVPLVSQVEYQRGQSTATKQEPVNCEAYLNFLMIKNSFNERLSERGISVLSSVTMSVFQKICEQCSYFKIKEVYADYSPKSNAIRIDMIIDNDFFIIVRKSLEELDNGIAVSLLRGDKLYMADYLDLNSLNNAVDYYIKG